LKIIQGTKRETLFSDRFISEVYEYFFYEPLHKELDSVIQCEYISKREDEIRSSGYAIHSLEAALWNFYHTNRFEDAILKAVNLGDDADTVGAITGLLAGAFYGIGSIPDRWVAELSRGAMISEIAERLIMCANSDNR